MRNPLTFRVESWVGLALISAFSAFLVGIFFLAVRNFGLDAEILAVSNSKAKLQTISDEEKVLIDNWLTSINDTVSADEVGYRFIVRKFPEKPWLEK